MRYSCTIITHLFGKILSVNVLNKETFYIEFNLFKQFTILTIICYKDVVSDLATPFLYSSQLLNIDFMTSSDILQKIVCTHVTIVPLHYVTDFDMLDNIFSQIYCDVMKYCTKRCQNLSANILFCLNEFFKKHKIQR